jgi:hypothetical protein
MIGSFGDMSGLYLRSITLPTSGLMVQDLIFGSEAEGYNNDGLDNVQLSGCPLLKTLNISNLSSYSGTLEISNCFNIKEIYAAGTKISKVNLPAFSWLNTLKLPETITELALINQVDLANSGLIFSSKTGLNPYRNISTLTINNCPKLDSYVLLNQVLNGMKEQIPTLVELKESIPLSSINASLEITQEIKNTLNNVGINTDNYFEQRGTKFKIKSGFEDTFKEEFENKVINYKKLKIDIKNIDWKFSSAENGEQFLLTLIDLISNPDTQAEYWITLEAPSLIGDCFIDATVSGASMALFKKTFPQLNVDAADTSSLISFYQWDEQSKTAIPLYRLEEKSYRKNEIISEFEYSRIKKIKSNEKFIFIEDNEFDIYFEIQDSGYKIKEDFNGLVIKLDENNDFITYTQTVRKGGYIYNPQDDLINDIYYSEMLSKKSTM